MRGLGQPPEGSRDLRSLERTLHRQVQDLAVLAIVEIEPKQEGPALFLRLAALNAISGRLLQTNV
jgi:hypothetical protein